LGFLTEKPENLKKGPFVKKQPGEVIFWGGPTRFSIKRGGEVITGAQRFPERILLHKRESFAQRGEKYFSGV